LLQIWQGAGGFFSCGLWAGFASVIFSRNLHFGVAFQTLSTTGGGLGFPEATAQNVWTAETLRSSTVIRKSAGKHGLTPLCS